MVTKPEVNLYCARILWAQDTNAMYYYTSDTGSLMFEDGGYEINFGTPFTKNPDFIVMEIQRSHSTRETFTYPDSYKFEILEKNGIKTISYQHKERGMAIAVAFLLWKGIIDDTDL